jgi:hypothetical protein
MWTGCCKIEFDSLLLLLVLAAAARGAFPFALLALGATGLRKEEWAGKRRDKFKCFPRFFCRWHILCLYSIRWAKAGCLT